CYCDGSNVSRMALLLPFAALIAARTGALPSAGPAVPLAPDRISVQVFTQPDCPFCDEVRRSVMPEIVKEFGSRVIIAHRSADELPSIRRTPTLILRSSRSGSMTRIIEGLPTLERLRGMIRDLETST